MEENKEDIKSLWSKMNEKSKEISTSVPEAMKIAEKLENLSTAIDFKDIKNYCSDFVCKIIGDVKGPLKPNKIFQFLLNAVLGEKCDEILPNIRPYSEDVDGIMRQLSEILQKIEEYVKYLKKQEEMDIKLVTEIKEFIQAIEKEQNSGLLIPNIDNSLSLFAQDTIHASKGPLKPDSFFQFLMNDVLGKQYNRIVPTIRRYSDNVDGVIKQLSKILQKIKKHMEYRKMSEEMDTTCLEKIKELKEGIEGEKKSSKKQPSGDEVITLEIVTGSKINNRLKTYLRENSMPSMSLVKSDDFDREPSFELMSVVDSEESVIHRDELMSTGSPEVNVLDAISVDGPRSHRDELMSTGSPEGNLSDAMSVDGFRSHSDELMSIGSSEGNLSDAMSVDEPRGNLFEFLIDFLFKSLLQHNSKVSYNRIRSL